MSTQPTQPEATTTIATLTRAMQAVGLSPTPDEWMLAAPDSRVWRGKPEEMMQVLAPYHPLLKPPSFMDMRT